MPSASRFLGLTFPIAKNFTLKIPRFAVRDISTPPLARPSLTLPRSPAEDIIQLIQKMPDLESITIDKCSKLDSIDLIRRLSNLDNGHPKLGRLQISNCPYKTFSTKKETYECLDKLLKKNPSLKQLILEDIGPLTWQQIRSLMKRLSLLSINCSNNYGKGCPILYDHTAYSTY